MREVNKMKPDWTSRIISIIAIVIGIAGLTINTLLLVMRWRLG